MKAIVPLTLEAQTYLIAAAFALARISGMLLVTPVFSRFAFTGLVRNAVGLALCIPLLPMIVETQKNLPLASPGIMAVLIGKEAAVGVIIGLVTAVPFWAAETAGSLLDTQRGASMAMTAGASGDQSNLTGALLSYVMLAVFLAAGGMHMTVGIFYESYGVWPVNQFLPVFGPDAGDRILSLLDNTFYLGLMLVIPVVIGLLLSDVLLGLVSRASPQLHIFDLSMNVKSLVFALLLTLYWGFMMSYMKYDLGTLADAKSTLEAIRGPATGR